MTISYECLGNVQILTQGWINFPHTSGSAQFLPRNVIIAAAQKKKNEVVQNIK